MNPVGVIAGAAALGAFSKPGESEDAPAGQLVWGHVSGQPVQLRIEQIGTTRDGKPAYLRSDAALAFRSMAQNAAIDGVHLEIDSALRTFEEQTVLRNAYLAGKGALAAPPGYSNHEGGIAVDINTDRGMNDSFFWLTANAHAYGFARTVASEPWHWELV